jgi:hypothetical protein
MRALFTGNYTLCIAGKKAHWDELREPLSFDEASRMQQR